MPFRVSGINFLAFCATLLRLAKVSQAAGKVLRGGSFNNNQNNAAASYRNNNNPNNDNNNFGFRVVLSAPIASLISE